MKKLLNLFLLSSLPVLTFAQLTTSTALTPQQMVQNVLLGGGITASNITFTGYNKAIGTFTAPAATNLGISGGLVITTGTAELNDPNAFGGGWPHGPSTNGSSWDNVGQGTSGDADLDNIVSLTTHNAAVLEFDFIPQADTVKFRYSFGSEEYNDYVGTSFNDVFAFFLSGVTTTLNQTNIALLPGTTIPVSINTVNNGNSFGVSTGPCTNCQYYNDNINGSINVVYDGLTKILTAIYPVICGETYHIKIAIADVGDGALDSGVFLEAGSFSANAPLIVSTDVQGSTNDTLFYEGCGAADIYFVRPQAQSTGSASYTYTVTGTAGNGVDYNPPLTGTFTFGAGQDSTTISINAINDGLTEGLESITIMMVDTSNACGNTDTIYKTIYIQDLLPLSLGTNSDTICYGQATALTGVAGGGQAPYVYTWTGPSGTIGSNASVIVSPTVTTTYTLSITDQCNSAPVVQTSTVVVQTGNSITALFDVYNTSVDSIFTEGCDSARLIINRAGTSLSVAETYTFTIGGTAINGTDYTHLGGNLPNVVNFPAFSTQQIFVIKAPNDAITEGIETILVNFTPTSVNICAVQQSIALKLQIRDLSPIVVNGNDTTICANSNALVAVTASGGAVPLTYNWSNGLGNAPSHYVSPTNTTTYTVTVTDNCGSQPVTELITVTTMSNPPSIAPIPDQEVCINRDPLNITTIITNGVPPLTYTWFNMTGTDVISQVNSTTANLPFVNTGGYFLFSVIDKCHKSDMDTVWINAVDCNLYIPNIVTPNGDNINEAFYIRNLHRYQNNSFSVFDRWGIRKYHSDDYKNDWIPSSLHDGQYYFILNVPELQEEHKGYFMIVH